MKQRISNKTYCSKKPSWVLMVIVAVFIFFIVAFFYLDRHNAISSLIKSLGPLGVLLAIFLMALLCMTPIPSEGLVLMYLKIYGVFWGTLLAWVGSNVGSLIIFLSLSIMVNFFSISLLAKSVSRRLING